MHTRGNDFTKFSIRIYKCFLKTRTIFNKKQIVLLLMMIIFNTLAFLAVCNTICRIVTLLHSFPFSTIFLSILLQFAGCFWILLIDAVKCYCLFGKRSRSQFGRFLAIIDAFLITLENRREGWNFCNKH